MSNINTNSLPGDSGFTLVELIIVIVIVGILASVAVPKFTNLSDSANEAKCANNRAAISYSVAVFYADTLLQNPQAEDWLEDTILSDVQTVWFATGEIPICPTTGSFTLNSGNVSCSIHST